MLTEKAPEAIFPALFDLFSFPKNDINLSF